MADEFTDEQCIAIALLHGATFWPAADYYPPHQLSKFWAIDAGFTEHTQCTYPDGSAAYSIATTREEAARQYCERHNLLR